MNIAFITAFYKTIFFKVISDRLQKNGYNVYWISTSDKWTKWLIKNGVSKRNILLISREESKHFQINSKLNNLINQIEDSSNTSLKSLVFMDRVISKWNWKEAKNYIAYLVEQIHEFITSRDIKVVVGEATALHEVLTSVICKFNNRYFFNPSTIRIPSDRFAFFDSFSQENFYEFANSEEEKNCIPEALETRNKIIEKGLKPNYWHWNNKIPTVNLSFIQKIVGKIKEALIESEKDATVKSLKYHLFYQKQYLKPFNYLIVKLMDVFEEPRDGEKYVLYTLHKQPEASIDVLGVKYQNQLELIKTIVKILPYDIMLYVKEHSNSLGDRSYNELKAIKKLPGVKLINPFLDIHKLIKNSELVITVSGTVAFEAGLHDKIAVTLSPMYFNKIDSVRYLEKIDEITKLLITPQHEKKFEEHNQYVLAHMIANSFEGIISDPISAPICMSEENIEKVTFGFTKVLNHIKTKIISV